MRHSAVRRRRWIVLLAGLVCLIGEAWYVYAHLYLAYVLAPPFHQHQVVSEFTENGVHVDLALERDSNGALVLAGTYTPMDAYVHLYSADLPRAGLNGAGRPTLLEVPTQAGVRPIGQLIADQPVILDQFPLLNTSFPVYPDGPVTLRLPIAVNKHNTQVVVDVTYMACSSTGFCLPPVENKRMTLEIASMH